MTLMELLGVLSQLVTIIGLPLAIFIFVYEQRRERQNEEEEIYQLLSDGYNDFLKLALENPDLRLMSPTATPDLTEEQQERTHAMFAILVSHFERAYLFAYEEEMSERKLRRWRSWEDFMREWCRREDFRLRLPQLLPGEDPEFARLLERIAREEEAAIAGTV